MLSLVEQSNLSNAHCNLRTNSNENKKAFALALLLSILYPFGGLIYTLWHWRENWAKNSFWLVCVYMGTVHVYWPEGTILGTGADGGRYVLRLMEWYRTGYPLKMIFNNYLVDINTMDLYQQLVTWVISRFTENGHVLFAVFATVFGYFYSRNIWYILEKMPEDIPAQFFILFTLFFLICPITHINGVRMWTALHVYVYALMPYLFENKKNRLLLLILTPLIHFSYLYIMLFGFLYAFIPYNLKVKNKIFLWFSLIFFIVTLFINSLNLSTISDILVEYSPNSYSNRIEGYVNQNVLDRNTEILSLNNWYVSGSYQIKYWCYSLLLLILFPYLQKYYKHNENYINWYIFTLLISAFANVTALIPSGGRFQLLAQMFSVGFILMITSRIEKNETIKTIILSFIILLFIPFVVDFRKLFDYYSITLLFGNFITVSFWENNIPLITYVKTLV